MSELNDLKQLVYKGYLEEEVEVEGKKFKLRTLSVVEEVAVLNEAGLEDYPMNTKQLMAYVPVVLKYCVVAVNSEDMTLPEKKMQLGQLFANAQNSELLGKLYAAYRLMEEKRAKAGEELKNSSAMPSPGSTGK